MIEDVICVVDVKGESYFDECWKKKKEDETKQTSRQANPAWLGCEIPGERIRKGTELNFGPTPSKYIEEAGWTESHNLGVIDHSIAFYFICPLYSPPYNILYHFTHTNAARHFRQMCTFLQRKLYFRIFDPQYFMITTFFDLLSIISLRWFMVLQLF